MAEKTIADVIIGGKVYTLSGYEDEAYLQKVASYINNKMNEMDAVEAFKRFPFDMKAVLVHLNIADDYFKAKTQLEKLEAEVEAKEKEIYDLKHDLVSNQIKADSDKEALKGLETENKELMLKVARLEAALEDAKEQKAQKAEKTTVFTTKKN